MIRFSWQRFSFVFCLLITLVVECDTWHFPTELYSELAVVFSGTVWRINSKIYVEIVKIERVTIWWRTLHLEQQSYCHHIT